MNHTRLDIGALTAIRYQAQRAAAAGARYTLVETCMDVIRARGEGWAAEVCGHTFPRRSFCFPALPWLSDGDAETIVLADQRERSLLAGTPTGEGS